VVEQALADGLLGAGELRLSGAVHDDQAPHSVMLCVVPELANRCGEGAASTGTWSYDLGELVEGDGVSQTLSLYAVDAAGNRSAQALTRHFRVDTVAPAIVVSASLQSVVLGDYLAPSVGPPVLSGTAADGGGVGEVFVQLEGPDGTTHVGIARREDDQWTFTPELRVAGRYTLTVAARDLAGNIASGGTYTLDVGAGPRTRPWTIYLPNVRSSR
jgi:hypothetical protein